jgi:prepilin-type N-terminal cleavage/methylation domain-containing protein
MKKIKNRKSKIENAGAFTLVELLVVMAIIGVLAAFIIPIMGSLKRREYISKIQAEMAQVETAIDGYKNTYNFYPPGNGNNTLTNSLYYELTGTTNNLANYYPLDGSAFITTNTMAVAFGVTGFVNCSTGSGEDARVAKNFLTGLRSTQIGTDGGPGVQMLIGSVGGPDQSYQPLGQQDLNPWRYLYPGVNNPNGYDLWIQLVINGQTNLICNWSSQVQINNNQMP